MVLVSVLVLAVPVAPAPLALFGLALLSGRDQLLRRLPDGADAGEGEAGLALGILIVELTF